MKGLSTYLTFKGDCEAAFNFYKTVFNAEFDHISRFGEMPPSEDFKMEEEDKNKVMHVSMRLADGAVLMGSDTGGAWAPKTVIGNNISLSITADSKEEADQLFAALSEDGKTTMAMAPTFWGDYFGMCTDKFSINWMISFNDNGKK